MPLGKPPVATARPSPILYQFDTIMKTLFPVQTVSVGGRSGNIQTPDRLLNVTSEKLRGDGAFLTGLSYSAQSGRSSVRGHDESALMKSQLE